MSEVEQTFTAALKSNDDIPILLETVVAGGYCIGCGACAAVKDSPLQIRLDEFGCFKAELSPGSDSAGHALEVSKVCPFSDRAAKEDELGAALFGEKATFDPHIGYHLATYAGYVAEGTFRASGSSGGMGKWILCELLRQDLVDAIIEVKENAPTDADPMLYRYRVVHSIEETRTGSKSVYYPVELSGVLSYVRENPGRYAITGVPCFIKAIRLLQAQDPVFRERIRFCVGLICGHLKSTKYAEMIAWQFGVEPGELSYIDFRKKLPGSKANEKGVEVRSRRADAVVKPPDIVQNVFGTNYGHGFFQYKACDFCDDVVGETADISVGDAWLPEYLKDGEGTNVVVVRHPVIHDLVERAIAEGRLHFQSIGAEKVIASQAGGFRQRREGLAYRLHLADQEGKWRPSKRVAPYAYRISWKRRRIYRMRMRLSERSHSAFQQALAVNRFAVFRQEMGPLIAAYADLYKPAFPLLERIKKAILRRLRRSSNK